MPVYSLSKGLTALLITELIFGSPALAAGNRCENTWLLKKVTEAHSPSAPSSPATEQERFNQAAAQLLKYADSLQKTFLEREFTSDELVQAMLAQLPVLFIGPPGNGKTAFGKAMLLNIVDEKTQQPSFYSMQMTQETTLADTHGSINYKVLGEEGRTQRNYDEGILGARTALVDEAFDIRAAALRNFLEVIAERSHSQGTQHYKGKTEFILAATNKTLAQVYEAAGDPEGPRAVIDRFAYVFYIPKELDQLKNKRSVFQNARGYNEPISQITYQQLETLRAYLPKVEIPDYVADLASLIQYRLGPKFESEEKKSEDAYKGKVQAGEKPLPPYRSAKYMSDRTLGAAGKILRAIVVLDYIKSGGQRSLTANTKDLEKLRKFYRINGPSTQVFDRQFKRAIKDYETKQLTEVKLERDITEPVFDETLKQFNDALTGLKLPDIDQKVREYNMLAGDPARKVTGAQERRMVVDVLKALYQRCLTFQAKNIMAEVTGESIAYEAAFAAVQDYARLLFGDKAPQVIASWEREANISSAALPHRKAQKLRYRYGYSRPQTVTEKTPSAKRLQKEAEAEANKWWVKARTAEEARKAAAAKAKAEAEAKAKAEAEAREQEKLAAQAVTPSDKTIELVDQSAASTIAPVLRHGNLLSHTAFEANDLKRGSQLAMSPDFKKLYFIDPNSTAWNLKVLNVDQGRTDVLFSANDSDEVQALIPAGNTVVLKSRFLPYLYHDGSLYRQEALKLITFSQGSVDASGIFSFSNSSAVYSSVDPSGSKLNDTKVIQDFSRDFNFKKIVAAAAMSPSRFLVIDDFGRATAYDGKQKATVPYLEKKDFTGARFVVLSESDVLMFPPTSANITYPTFLTITSNGQLVNPFSGKEPQYWRFTHPQFGDALHASVDQTGKRVVVVQADKVEIFDKETMIQVLREGNEDKELKPLLTIKSSSGEKLTGAYLRADGKLIVRTDNAVEIYDLAKP